MSDDSTEVYEVEKILDRIVTENGEVYYFLKWKDYSSEENSWQIASDLNCPLLIVEFEKVYLFDSTDIFLRV